MSALGDDGKQGPRSPEEVLRQARIAHSTRMASLALINRVSDKHSTTRQRRASLVRLQFDPEPSRLQGENGYANMELNPGYGDSSHQDGEANPDAEAEDAADDPPSSDAVDSTSTGPNGGEPSRSDTTGTEAGIVVGDGRSTSSSTHRERGGSGDMESGWDPGTGVAKTGDEPHGSSVSRAPAPASFLHADGPKPLFLSSSLPDGFVIPPIRSTVPLTAWADSSSVGPRPTAAWGPEAHSGTAFAATPMTPRTPPRNEHHTQGFPQHHTSPPSPPLVASSATQMRRNTRASAPSGAPPVVQSNAPLPSLRPPLIATADGTEVTPPPMTTRAPFCSMSGVPLPQPSPLQSALLSEQPSLPPSSQLPLSPPPPPQQPSTLGQTPALSPVLLHAPTVPASAPLPRFRDRIFSAIAPLLLPSQGSSSLPSPSTTTPSPVAGPAPGSRISSPGSPATAISARRHTTQDCEHGGSRYAGLAAAAAAAVIAGGPSSGAATASPASASSVLPAATSAPLPCVNFGAVVTGTNQWQRPGASCSGVSASAGTVAASAGSARANGADDSLAVARSGSGFSARLRVAPASARGTRSGPLLRPCSRGLSPSAATSTAAAAAVVNVAAGGPPVGIQAQPMMAMAAHGVALPPSLRGQVGHQSPHAAARPLAAAAAPAAGPERPAGCSQSGAKGSGGALRWGPGTYTALYGNGVPASRLRGSDGGCSGGGSVSAIAEGHGAEYAHQEGFEGREQEQGFEFAPAGFPPSPASAALLPSSRAASPATFALPSSSSSGGGAAAISVAATVAAGASDGLGAGRIPLPAQPQSSDSLTESLTGASPGDSATSGQQRRICSESLGRPLQAPPRRLSQLAI